MTTHFFPHKLLTLLLFTCTAFAQVGMEVAPRADSLYPAVWPAGPGRESVPSWAVSGRIRFARWDGGRIETAKAMLSGWPGFNPPDPNRLETMTNWYQPETVSLLREAGINMIWVTFSNGFSIRTEAPHQEQVRRYIDECHRQGIRVMAYESIANMFWEDMYEYEPAARDWPYIGKDGKPVPYGAGDYSKMGRVTRYMADLRKPGWRDYLRRRIDLAIDAGADGVIYDNNFSEHLLDTYPDLYGYAAGRKRDFLLMGNFHENTYVFNRLINAITTEDGLEPGIYTEANASDREMAKHRVGLLPAGGGMLVNNIGLFRIHRALAEGWKPVMIEDGHRETGVRETTPMSGPRHKLALAEAMMFGISMELFVEGTFAHGLRTGDPATMSIWQAIGQYNRFFGDNREYYEGARSLAKLAIVLDDRSESASLLNGLAARKIVYDVVYDHDLTEAALAPYAAAAVLTAATLRSPARAALEKFAARGGRVFPAGSAGPSLDELARALAPAARGAVQVEAPPEVLYNAAAQPGRVLVHLLHYGGGAARNVKIELRGRFTGARLLSPDAMRGLLETHLSPSGLSVEVPQLGTYALIVAEGAVN